MKSLAICLTTITLTLFVTIAFAQEKDGQSRNIGEGKGSEVSDAVIATVAKPDPRPICIGVWGDCSEISPLDCVAFDPNPNSAAVKEAKP